MSARPRPDAVVETVLRLYEQEGKSLRECGAAVGKTRSAVWHIVRGRAKRKRLPRVTDAQRARVVEVYRTGATLEAAAEAARCSVATAWQHLKKLGLLRGQRPAADVGARIDEALAEGLTPWEVSQRLGLQLAALLKHIRGP